MMKNLENTIKTIVLSFLVIILTFGGNVYATDENTYQYELEKKYIMEYLSLKENVIFDIKDPIELYDSEENPAFLCFSLNDKGYIIINRYDFSIPEYSLRNSNVFLNSKKKIYYDGPLNYLELSGEELIDAKSGMVLSTIDEFKIKSRLEMNDKLSINEKLKKIDTLMEYKEIYRTETEPIVLSHKLETYDYNPDGRCGSVATAILLQYYDNNINESYVPDRYDYENGLINHLVPYIEGTSMGSTPEELKNGLNDYLDDQNIINPANLYSYSISRIKSKIDSDRPIIVDLNNHSTYNEHWVVAHGYNIVDKIILPDIVTVIVNDGWGNNDINIDPANIGKLVYLDD